MANYIVYYNPLAGNGEVNAVKERVTALLEGNDLTFESLTQLGDKLPESVAALDPGTKILIAGGDGTVNRFVNAVDCDSITNEIYLYAAGNGNDFFNDLKAHAKEFFPLKQDFDAEGITEKSTLFQINDFIKNLPVVTVNGKDYKFINGIGYGIDGYCCEVGDKLKAEGKKVNYTGIAIKGLLFHFKPKNAKVVVDGKEYSFKKVWIAPAMNGCYYGGGMIPTPAQNRKTGNNLSLCVMYGKGKIGTLMLFPKIFKGEHVKNQKAVKILEGREITVKFDAPCALQIDGETILNVSEYTARI